MCQGETKCKISNYEETHQDNMQKKDVYILAIDGGGIKGLIPAIVLKNLEEELGGPISSYFDVIAGTSTGGLLALGLNVKDPETGGAKYSAKEISDVYLNEGEEIFKESFWRKLKTGFSLFGSKYSSKGIAKVTKKYFGDSTLKDTITNTLVPAFEVSHDTPFYFKSSYAKANPKKHNYLMRNVAQGTSAAPVLFKPVKLTNEEGKEYTMIDASVMRNNPASAALLYAKELYPNAERFHLLSLGTGRVIDKLDQSVEGVLDLLPLGTSYLFDCGGEAVNTEMEGRFKLYQKSERHRNSTYLRVDCVLGKTSIDDISEEFLQMIQQKANEQYEKQSSEITDFAAKLKKNKAKNEKAKKPSKLARIFGAIY